MCDSNNKLIRRIKDVQPDLADNIFNNIETFKMLHLQGVTNPITFISQEDQPNGNHTVKVSYDRAHESQSPQPSSYQPLPEEQHILSTRSLQDWIRDKIVNINNLFNASNLSFKVKRDTIDKWVKVTGYLIIDDNNKLNYGQIPYNVNDNEAYVEPKKVERVEKLPSKLGRKPNRFNIILEGGNRLELAPLDSTKDWVGDRRDLLKQHSITINNNNVVSGGASITRKHRSHKHKSRNVIKT